MSLPHAKPNLVQRPPRFAMTADLTVVDDLGRELYSKLWNISEGGFMAECEEKLRIGQTVEVELPTRGRVRAEVRWVLGWRFGAMIL
ncbi:MAG: PilZ domain-containing protein [Allosphingosinicella sp.]